MNIISGVKSAVSSGKWESFDFNDALFSDLMGVVNTLDDGISALSGLINNGIVPILKTLQIFLTSFNSIFAILNTFISFAQGQLKALTSNLANAGVFVNILIPPAYSQLFSQNEWWGKLSTGGFDGFLERLQVSFYNTQDPYRPQFESNAVVGGLILVFDTETVDDLWKSIKFLAGCFDFVKLFPIDLNPQPPVNLRGTPAMYQQENGKYKFGIKVEWDAPPVPTFSTYRLYRMISSAPSVTTQTIVPTALVGEFGIIYCIGKALSTGKWPTKPVAVYNTDPGFNSQKPVELPLGSKVYIDYEVYHDKLKQYFYVMQAGVEPFWSDPCPVYSVQAYPVCIPDGAVGAIQHGNGTFEFLSGGTTSELGRWNGVMASTMIPFIIPLIGWANNFLESLKANLKKNSSAMVEFINSLVAKFQYYQQILETIITGIIAIENFFAGLPNIAGLAVPPAAGGVDGFMDRVRGATRPASGFSGAGGTTLGVVIVYGATWNPPFATGATEQAWNELAAQNTKIAEKVLNMFLGIFTK